MQRQDTALKELYRDNSMLVLHSQETLALLKYLTQPFTNPGSTTLLSTVWPELLNDVVVEKLMKKGTNLDTVHQEQHLHEDNKELCTYLRDGEEDSSPCLLPLVNYADTYNDSTDGSTADTLAITPPLTKRLAINSVSAPKKTSHRGKFTTPSNKVTFKTPTGEDIAINEDDELEDDDNLFLTQQSPPPTPKTSKSIKRSATAAATEAHPPPQRRGKRLPTTTAYEPPPAATHKKNKPPDDLNDYIANSDDDINDEVLNDDDDHDKIIA